MAMTHCRGQMAGQYRNAGVATKVLAVVQLRNETELSSKGLPSGRREDDCHGLPSVRGTFSMRSCSLFMTGTLMLLGVATMANADIQLGKPGAHEAFDLGRHAFLSQSHATFEKQPGTWAWISDVEHVVEKEKRELVFLADGDPAYTMGTGNIPAGKYFELFPYHYYDQWEVEQLGGKVNYRLAAQNRTDTPITITIDGEGTTRDWDHGVAWEAALADEGKHAITLQPGEVVTLWEEKQLEGGLPWSGIFLGRATGELYVTDYCYIGDEDPGFAHARPMPDLSWQPYELASFSRGHVDWNAAELGLFPRHRDAEGRLSLKAVPEGIHSIAFGYSPGGPPSNLCYYNAVPSTFARDENRVIDPVSNTNHLFFGGNYPVMYRFPLRLNNDTSEHRAVSFFLASNDIFGVDSLVGVWIDGRLLRDRVAMWEKNQHWRVFTITLAPGETFDQDFTVVSLGGRWGGVIGSFDFQALNP